MTGLDLAGLLKEYGGWGLSAILMLVVAKLYADNQKLSTGYIERLIAGLEAAKDAAEGTQKALMELRNLIDASGRTVGDLSHQIAILVEKVQHGFGNTTSAMEGFLRLLERERSRDDRGRP